ncbi:MAG: hypothetical protein H3C29_10475 [Simplicispira suum]|uniref:hypothetical protein n=1 Tax=Simplicispira suum TaxID=2109915 RepID=UPI001C6C5EF7|nr:hypothetical protein [Simplicispira suum]MBW7833629.1 hypothetical protein [Simplicispira suum]
MATNQPSTSLTTINNAKVAEQLRDLATQVQSGAIKSYEFKQTANSVTFSVDSADGSQRVIKHQDVRPGLSRNSTEHIQKQSAEDRRTVVKELTLEGLSQQDIADRTITSQKTISNDIRKLKASGEL